jgi:hypothetical protein
MSTTKRAVRKAVKTKSKPKAKAVKKVVKKAAVKPKNKVIEIKAKITLSPEGKMLKSTKNVSSYKLEDNGNQVVEITIKKTRTTKKRGPVKGKKIKAKANLN